MVRYLVEEIGFRTVAFEDDFAGGVAIDRYVTTGVGDVRQLVSSMSSPFWSAEEIVEPVEWMRAYNEAHPDDPVRFLGTDVLQLRESSFDAITDHVALVAPQRLVDLEGGSARCASGAATGSTCGGTESCRMPTRSSGSPPRPAWSPSSRAPRTR